MRLARELSRQAVPRRSSPRSGGCRRLHRLPRRQDVHVHDQERAPFQHRRAGDRTRLRRLYQPRSNPALKAPEGNQELFLGIAGARRVVEGKATTASGMVVKKGKLVIRLTTPQPNFLSAMWFACILPTSLRQRSRSDPEGIRAPVPSTNLVHLRAYSRREGRPRTQPLLRRNPAAPHRPVRRQDRQGPGCAAGCGPAWRARLRVHPPRLELGARARALRTRYSGTKGNSGSSPARSCACSCSTRRVRCSETTPL